MKKIINKILFFFGIKKVVETQEPQDKTQDEQLIDLLCDGRKVTNEATTVEIASRIPRVAVLSPEHQKIVDEADKITKDFVQARAEDIKKMSNKIDALRPEQPVTGEIKSEILVFDEQAKKFKKIPKKVQDKALQNVNKKVEATVEEYKKTKNSEELIDFTKNVLKHSVSVDDDKPAFSHKAKPTKTRKKKTPTKK